MEFLEEQRRVFDAGRRNFRRGRDFVPPKEILAKFDKDGDGKLSREERRAMFDEARKKREALIKKYDADGDGKLNDAEKTKLIQDPEVQEMMKRNDWQSAATSAAVRSAVKLILGGVCSIFSPVTAGLETGCAPIYKNEFLEIPDILSGFFLCFGVRILNLRVDFE